MSTKELVPADSTALSMIYRMSPDQLNLCSMRSEPQRQCVLLTQVTHTNDVMYGGAPNIM